MSIIAWIVVGLIAGALAKAIVPGREPGGFVATLVIGIVGACIGGWIWNAMGSAGATGVNLPSIGIATVGAIVLLAIWKMFTGRTATY